MAEEDMCTLLHHFISNNTSSVVTMLFPPLNSPRNALNASTSSSLTGRVSWNSALMALLFLGSVYRALHPPPRDKDNVLIIDDTIIHLPRQAPYQYKLNSFYSYSRIERYTIEHAVQLKYSRLGAGSAAARGCTLLKPSSRTIYGGFVERFLPEMDLYNALLNQHPGSPVPDIRHHSTNATRHEEICQSLQVHPQGLGAVFASGSLARSPQGLLEPIYPPFGSVSQICNEKRKKKRKIRRSSTRKNTGEGHDLDFLVHDFLSTCRRIQATSKIILVDIGYKVSSKWQSRKRQELSAAESLVQLYQNFGFPVDQITIFDTSHPGKKDTDWISRIFRVDRKDTQKKTDGFTFKGKTGRSNHPWDWIAANTSPKDLVLVTVHFPPRGQEDPSKEMELIQELLSSSNAAAAKRIDGLFFHPIVYMAEDEPRIASSSNTRLEKMLTRHFPKRHHGRDDEDDEETLGEQQQEAMRLVDPAAATAPRWTIQEAMQLFSKLREQGIMAHAWVQ